MPVSKPGDALRAPRTTAVVATDVIKVSRPSTKKQFSVALSDLAQDGVNGVAITPASVASAGAVSGTTGTFTGAVTSTTEKADYRRFLGIDSVVVTTVGTFTATRTARGLPTLAKTAAANTSILVIDITEELRSAASKGFKLNTIDVAWINGTADLTAHTATLDAISYANTVAATVTAVPITGTLGLTQNANPFVATLTVTTPAYPAATVDKYVLEITVNAALTSAYSLIGARLNFARNDL